MEISHASPELPRCHLNYCIAPRLEGYPVSMPRYKTGPYDAPAGLSKGFDKRGGGIFSLYVDRRSLDEL